MKNMFYLLSVILLICGCTAASVIDGVVKEYYTVQDEIKIGDSKEKVLALLEVGNSKLKIGYRKPSTRYTRDGSVYDIYYARRSQY